MQVSKESRRTTCEIQAWARCEVDRELFRGESAAADGPMLIALDSNVIFDLQRHGNFILDHEHAPGIDDSCREKLDALGAILDLWQVRDIRFIVVPPARHDFKRSPTQERLVARERLFGRIDEARTTGRIDQARTTGTRNAKGSRGPDQ